MRRVLGLPHIASGDLFRDVRRQDTPLAREVRGFMDRGDYVPDYVTNKLVLDRLSQSDAHDGFILDGYPRTLAQAEALDLALARTNRRVERALYITVPTATLIERVQDRIVCPQCHAIYNEKTNPPMLDMVCDSCTHGLVRRSDESPDVVRHRLETYARQTEPVVAYYETRGVLTRIDGSLDLQEVETAVDGALGLRGVS